MPKQLSYDTVLQWVSLATGLFNTKQIWAELNIISSEGKAYLRVCLNRMVEAGVVVKTSVDGTFRRIDNERKPIEWGTADATATFNVKWPFELEKYVCMYPKSLAIIAGSKQEGKTTFLYNFIKLNLTLASKYKIELFNSETGKEQMQDKFFNLGVASDSPFAVYERYDNFADILDPDAITVIDYLDMNSEFYMAGVEIDNIFRKLNNGICIIGMQIPPPMVSIYKGVKKVVSRDYAYGGGTTAKRAFVYVSMSNHILKLKHAKKPANPKIHPENMMWSYAFNEDGDFCNIQRYTALQEDYQT